MSAAQKLRVFFALWPDAETASHLAALGENLVGGCGGRVMPAANLHMTLAFIGAVTPAQIERLVALAAGVRCEAFDLRLDRLGFWPQGGILWAGCRQAPSCQRRLFAELASGVRAAGFTLDARTPVPHVTLARRARCASLPRLGTPLGWRADEFALVESIAQPVGVRYRVLETFPLDLPDIPISSLPHHGGCACATPVR
ncbi:MAG: RNA 2',3'-cyclic phosphodiesterase [Gallionella sp.]|nr:RNA 2',3'-cyclic phosphodiesterase [Gallionella sp.]